MTILLRHWIGAALLGSALTFIISPATSYAQGSAGGSIGNDDKAVSGSRSEPRSAKPERSSRKSKSEDEPRRASSRRSGGGGGGGNNADGTWVVSSVGVTCPDTLTETMVVTGGRIVSANGSATVSPNGTVTGVGNYSGIIVRSQGRMVGRTGSGTFTRSDGCTGRWTSAKQ